MLKQESYLKNALIDFVEQLAIIFFGKSDHAPTADTVPILTGNRISALIKNGVCSAGIFDFHQQSAHSETGETQKTGLIGWQLGTCVNGVFHQV